MINNLITHLKEEALEDAEHKGLCDTELTTNTQTRKEKTATVEKFHDTVDELDASMENLAMEVAKLQVSHQVEVHEGPRFVVRQSRDTDWENSFFRGTRTRGCAYSSLHQHDLGVERSVGRLFRGVHEHAFARIQNIEAESDSRYVWKLRKALNDLKKASQPFSNYLSDILVDKLGFEKCPLVPFGFEKCPLVPFTSTTH